MGDAILSDSRRLISHNCSAPETLNAYRYRPGKLCRLYILASCRLIVTDTAGGDDETGVYELQKYPHDIAIIQQERLLNLLFRNLDPQTAQSSESLLLSPCPHLHHQSSSLCGVRCMCWLYRHPSAAHSVRHARYRSSLPRCAFLLSRSVRQCAPQRGAAHEGP